MSFLLAGMSPVYPFVRSKTSVAGLAAGHVAAGARVLVHADGSPLAEREVVRRPVGALGVRVVLRRLGGDVRPLVAERVERVVARLPATRAPPDGAGGARGG